MACSCSDETYYNQGRLVFGSTKGSQPSCLLPASRRAKPQLAPLLPHAAENQWVRWGPEAPGWTSAISWRRLFLHYLEGDCWRFGCHGNRSSSQGESWCVIWWVGYTISQITTLLPGRNPSFCRRIFFFSGPRISFYMADRPGKSVNSLIKWSLYQPAAEDRQSVFTHKGMLTTAILPPCYCTQVLLESVCVCGGDLFPENRRAVIEPTKKK